MNCRPGTMVRTHIGLLGGALVTGGLGWMAGAHHQRLRGQEAQTLAHVTHVSRPGLPQGATVSVARGLSVQVISRHVQEGVFMLTELFRPAQPSLRVLPPPA